MGVFKLFRDWDDEPAPDPLASSNLFRGSRDWPGFEDAVTGSSETFHDVPRTLPKRAVEETPDPNPDPRNFRIQKTEAVGRYLGALIRYPDCTNFEGDKVIVFEDMDHQSLVARAEIDPHFKEDGQIIARFKPDQQGWDDAIAFMGLKLQVEVSD